MDMMAFPLIFNRLISGELSLPPLYYPQPSNATPCDAWYSITNISNGDVRIELGVDLAPEISDLINVEVLSRFSNSLMKGWVSLAANGTIEIRIRAAVKTEMRRLSDVSSNLTNPNGKK